jgi:hypothetical protein
VNTRQKEEKEQEEEKEEGNGGAKQIDHRRRGKLSPSYKATKCARFIYFFRLGNGRQNRSFYPASDNTLWR